MVIISLGVRRFAAWLLCFSVIAGCSGESGSDGDESSSTPVVGPVPSGGGQTSTVPDQPVPTAGDSAGAMTPAQNGDPGATPPAGMDPTMPPATMGEAGAGAMPPPAMNTPGQGTCLAAGDGSYRERGPYQVGTVEVDLGSGICPGQGQTKFTIFHPMPLEASCAHPIVAWGNGTAVADATTYAFFNENAASWGMVVIASWDPMVGCGEYHKKGLDYLLAQNADPSSMFYQKLSTRAGVAGHSQGGMGATVAASHPNVEAVVSVAGGGVPPAGKALMCITGTMDLMEGPCTMSYQATTGAAFLADYEGADHFVSETVAGYIARQPATLEMQRVFAAWFRCMLADDATACGLFEGAPASCGICSDPGWAKAEARNM